MSTTVVDLFKAASQLDEADRATLAGLLLESLDQPPSTGVEAAWAEEIERRIAQIDAGEVELKSWHDIKARLLASEHAGQKR